MLSTPRKVFEVIMSFVVCLISVVFMVAIATTGIAFNATVEAFEKLKANTQHKAIELTEC